MLLNNCIILICSQPNLKLNLIKLMICQSFYLIFFQSLLKKSDFCQNKFFVAQPDSEEKLAYLITLCRRLSKLWRTDSGSHLYSKKQDYLTACDGLKKINCWLKTTQFHNKLKLVDIKY